MTSAWLVRVSQHSRLCSGVAVAALLLPAGVVAQTVAGQTAAPAATAAVEPADGLGDIIVTARRRSESLQDVPVAVIAITQNQLQNNAATSLAKVAELAPQVVIGRASSGTGAILTIRGISTSTSDSGLDQSVSVVLDDIPLSRGRIVTASLFDLQQVEVLQGPQALFFGKNSPAGVIALHTADPKDHFEGYLNGGYEFKAKERFAEGAVSIPLTPTLRLRVAGRYDYLDGWVRNLSQPGPNPFQPAAPLPGALNGDTGPKGSDASLRATLVWAPTSDFTAKLKFTYDRQSLNSNSANYEGFCIGGITVPTQFGVPMPNADCAKNMSKSESALPAVFAVNYPYGNGGVPFDRTDFNLTVLTLNKSFDKFTLTSNSGYYSQTHKAANNADYSAFVQIYDSEQERYKLATQEIRLDTTLDGPLNFMTGAYFEHSDRDWINVPDLFNVYDPVNQNYATTVQTSHSNNDSYSAFAQARFKIIPTLELAAGARYSKDDKRTTLLNVENNHASATGRSLYPQGVPLTSRYEGDNVSPEVTLTWKPERHQTIYAAYKTGYKAGGISNAGLLPASATAANIRFGAEKVDGFEIGYKADLFDRRVRLDLVGYRYNYNGLQVTSFDSTLIRYRVTNAAGARTEGLTASANWLATDSLSFEGNIGYNRARYLSFTNAQCYTGETAAMGCVGGTQDLSGKPLNRAPDVTFMLGGDYKHGIGRGWTADLSLSGSYSDSYQTETDYGPGGLQDAFWRVNAALHLTPKDERFDIAVIGRNLTDAYYLVSTTQWPGVGNPNEYVGAFNRPREVILQATFRF